MFSHNLVSKLCFIFAKEIIMWEHLNVFYITSQCLVLSKLPIKNIFMLAFNYINIYLFTYTKPKCITYVVFKLKAGYVPINQINI